MEIQTHTLLTMYFSPIVEESNLDWGATWLSLTLSDKSYQSRFCALKDTCMFQQIVVAATLEHPSL
jgi:hypothetical protein